MRRMWWLRGLRFAAMALLAVGLIAAVVMTLWNAVLPGLFGWPVLGFWQALGLLLLSRMLFGGLRGGRGGHWRARMAERWARMSDAERATFRETVARGCGRRDAAGAAPR